jgi:hypothetical protein
MSRPNSEKRAPNKASQTSDIPLYVEPFLFSYDTDELDLKTHKKRIITNVLNYGTKQATDWVREQYSQGDIVDAIKNPLAGEWNQKSLNYWSLIYDVSPGSLERHISEPYA